MPLATETPSSSTRTALWICIFSMRRQEPTKSRTGYRHQRENLTSPCDCMHPKPRCWTDGGRLRLLRSCDVTIQLVKFEDIEHDLLDLKRRLACADNEKAAVSWRRRQSCSPAACRPWPRLAATPRPIPNRCPRASSRPG